MSWSALLLFLSISQVASPARILGIFPYGGVSHFYVFRPLMEELARRGHDVHVVGHHPRKEPLQNYTDVSLKDLNFPDQSHIEFEVFEKMETTWYSNLQGLFYLTKDYDKILSKPEVLALTNSTFDLVIMEMFNSNLFYALSYKIGAPVIGFSSCQMLSFAEDSLGVPNDLPYLPHLIGGHGLDMDFFERLLNTIELWLERAFYKYVFHHDAQAFAESYLGPMPPLAEIAANTSLLLVNSHFSLFGLRPLPSSVIEVGGINVLKPKPLPEDLANIFNNSKGVIYFSMGSVMKGSSLPVEKQKMFINVLKETGRTILWKREDHLKTHHNIHARPWFPQRDILAHPKIELFISHCGLLGVNEAIASGVPLICIPMFGDQIHNAKQIARVGAGLMIRYLTLSEIVIKEAVNDILSNKVYKQRMSELSAAYTDRPMSPLETAVFWVEYYLKHGPRPFDAPVKQMTFWQRLGYDIAATIIISVSILIYVFMVLVKLLFLTKPTIKEKQS